MKTKVLITLLVMFLLSASAGLGSQTAYAADSPITVYVIPPISDTKILPTTAIAESYISDEISIVASPGEYEPASFVIHALEEISSLEIEATELTGAGYSIPSSNVDIRVVKCWYQAGDPLEAWKGWGKLLTPELLLKDDSLVNVENGENYLKLTTGEYLWISDPKTATDLWRPRTIEEIPVKDSDALLPVDIPAGENKQFWITIKVPEQAEAGTYRGTISLGNQGEIELQLEVLPINLLEPHLTYSLYYQGRLNEELPQGSISAIYKSEEQFRKELQNMLNHGVKNPNCDQYYYEPDLARYLEIRNEVGMGGQSFYLHGLGPSGYQPVDEVQQFMEFLAGYGYTDVYFYGQDEASGQALLDQRASWQAIREAGGKIFTACHGNAFDLVGDLLDVAVYHGTPSAEEAAKWNSEDHQIFCYSNPQVGVERTEIYRRNFGLLLWQAGYDGAMNFAYQEAYGNIWNDFDYNEYRDHVFAYPTMNGVIDTIQWEGWREGVDDIRYLTTLLDAIERAKMQGIDTSAAENWLAALKSSDLTQQNLDVVRSQMIDYILSLQGEPQNLPPILSPIGDKSVNEGELLTFITSATDPDDDSLTYSASNLPQGASFDPNTQTFFWAPDEEAGIYPDVHFEVSDGSMTDSEDITITVISFNLSPILNPIGDKLVSVGELLQFTIYATDPHAGNLTHSEFVSADDPHDASLIYSASNLPPGASFDPNTQTFSWIPDEAGIYPNVHFEVSDGSMTDSEDITIIVSSASQSSEPNPIDESLTHSEFLSATDPGGEWQKCRREIWLVAWL